MNPIQPEILSTLTLEELPFEPIMSQAMLVEALSAFMASSDPRGVFVLNGYAGTGKTSLTGAFIRALERLRVPIVLLAPTGRAAKVAAGFSGHKASTIHKRLYRGNTVDPGNTTFFLAPNELSDALFIVDEASLISDSAGGGRSLLSHLIRHVYSAPGCRMLLIGDEAQLPPVGQTSGTAMNHDRLRALGLNPVGFTLDIPVRQAVESGIIHNATFMRQMLMTPRGGEPELALSGFPDVEAVSSADLADMLSDSWSSVGMEETLVITRSNKRANNINNAIRSQVMYAEDPLQRGDRIIISKNDYYWGKRNEMKTFIANGDMAEVTWIGKTEKAYGRYFCDVELRMVSDDIIVGAKLMLRSLASEGPSIPREEMERFYNRVLISYDGALSEQIKGVMEDPYYNALQAKYAYCVTCHKAQGGQWKHVYIDMGSIPPDAIDSDFYRWIYTAITRATEKVYFINPGIRLT